MTAEEAVAKFVKDGAQISLGGFTVNRNPMALAHEIIRQGRKDLYVVCHSHGQALDLLIGAGCVARLEIAYGGLGRFAPTCIRFRKAVCEGRISISDYSNYHMSLRFLAGGLGLPFIPATSGFQTDIVRMDGFSKGERGQGKVPLHKLVVQEDPFNPGRETILLPALNPDVAILHAQYLGEDGTVRMKGLTFADLEQARSAHHVIVSCEKIVSEEFIRNDPDQNCLAGFMVDAIVPAPFGAHPTACFGFYDYDPIHLKHYAKAASQDHTFQEYLDEWVRSISSHQEYIEKLGEPHLANIAADPVLGYAPGLDRR